MTLKRMLRLLCAAGVWMLCRCRLMAVKRDFFAVLYYHNIRADQRRRFARQLARLRAYGSFVRICEDGSIKGLDPGSGRPCYAVTFDDAFEGVFTNALPEILVVDIPVVVFVPTGYLDVCPGWTSRNWASARDKIVGLDVLTNLESSHVTIGSHTVTHPDLTALGDDDLQRELVQSKASLERDLGKRVGTFSFPHGKFNDRVMRACRDAEYARVFTIEPMVNEKNPDLYAIHRIAVEPDDLDVEFYLKANGYYVPSEKVWQTTRRYLRPRD